METAVVLPQVYVLDGNAKRSARLSEYLSEFFVASVISSEKPGVSDNGLLLVATPTVGLSEVRLLSDWRIAHSDSPVIFYGQKHHQKIGIEVLRAGADDFVVIEDDAHWRELPLAINRAVQRRERKLAQERSLHDSLDHALSLAAILDSVHEGILCFDELGVINVFNAHAEALFGYTADEIIGTRFVRLLPPHVGHDVWVSMLEYHAGGDPKFVGQRVELIGRHRNDSCFPMEITVSETQISGRKHYVASIEDISVRKEIEASLRFHVELEALITLWCTRFINLDIEQVLPSVKTALEDIGSMCHVDRSQITLFDTDSQYVTCISEWCTDGALPQISEIQQEPLSLAPNTWSQILNDEVVIWENIEQMPQGPDRDLLLHDGVKSVLLVPMRSNERVIGALIMDSIFAGRVWSPQEIAQLQLAAVMLASAFARRERELALRAAHEELTLANSSLQHMARIDSLTQLANRRHFDEAMHQEYRRAQREHKPLAVVLCDVDNFKAYNDTYGHQSGDACLISVAQALMFSFQRAGEFCARYGGEEFVILLPGNDLAQAMNAAERARIAIAEKNIPHRSNEKEKCVTASFGVAVFEPNSSLSAHNVLQCADKALYEAKRAGRNRTMCFGLVPGTALTTDFAHRA